MFRESEVRKVKKDTYYRRWIKNHKVVRFYLTYNEYLQLEKVCKKYNLNPKELLLRMLKLLEVPSIERDTISDIIAGKKEPTPKPTPSVIDE